MVGPLPSTSNRRLYKDQFGDPISVDARVEGPLTTVTPLTGKFCVEIGDYIDHETFVLGEMAHCDVMLGMPWCRKSEPSIDRARNKLRFLINGKDITLDVKDEGNLVPMFLCI